jgi:hypothetical protein
VLSTAAVLQVVLAQAQLLLLLGWARSKVGQRTASAASALHAELS